MGIGKFISETERKAIEAAVGECESKTSGEIVPVIVGASSAYGWIGYRAALLGWGGATLFAVWMHFYRPFVLEFWETQALQVLGLVFGWLFSRTRFGLRLFVSERARAEEVEQAAYMSFVRNGLMNTRDRTGVLVFVSLRERRVQVLADEGIHRKVDEGFWDQVVSRISGAIRDGRPAEGLVSAIQEIGEKLHAHFPRRPDDKNELPNQVRGR